MLTALSIFNDENNQQNDIKSFKKDRIDFKLSLRKKNYIRIFYEKRNIKNNININKENISLNGNKINNASLTSNNNNINNPEEIKWSLELSLEKIPNFNNKKNEFTSIEEKIKTGLEYISYHEPVQIKYGLCLLKDVLNEKNLEKNGLGPTLGYMDWACIDNLILIMKDICIKNEKEIVFKFINN